MKKIFTIIALFFLLSCGNSFSQSFTFLPTDTIRYEIPGYTMVFNNVIGNNTPNNLTIDVLRTKNVSAAGWSSFFCLKLCYPDSIDSVRIVLAPHEQQSLTVDVTPDTTRPDSQNVMFCVRAVSNPSNTHCQVFHAITRIPAGVNDIQANRAIIDIYPCPVISGNDFKLNISNLPFGNNANSAMSLVIYNMIGSTVSTIHNLNPGVNSLRLDLPAGIYSYSLISGNVTITSGKIAACK